MSISDRISALKKQLPDHVTLVAVSKTKPASDILLAYQGNQRHFGENKVQEMLEKHEVLLKDISWHLIGHLQTNKVKFIAPFVSLIHSVDSLKLLKEIDKQAAKNDRIIDCLLQFHIAEEETKFGLSLDEAIQLLRDSEYLAMKNIRIVGIMGMASFTENIIQVKLEFSHLKTYFDQLKSEFFPSEKSFKEISMGMSGDYDLAIAEGSTMIRVGSSIFGGR